MREALRAATSDIHARMHTHAGFAAVQNARVTRDDYRALLIRLYGFYLPFEAATGMPPERSRWLADDLTALGSNRPASTIPLCPAWPNVNNPHARLGAHYVAEGSALGGVALARGLDHLLGRGTLAGRRFFTGHGPATGQAWRGFVARLEALPSSQDVHDRVIAGAVATFAAFETWMAGWRQAPHE